MSRTVSPCWGSNGKKAIGIKDGVGVPFINPTLPTNPRTIGNPVSPKNPYHHLKKRVVGNPMPPKNQRFPWTGVSTNIEFIEKIVYN